MQSSNGKWVITQSCGSSWNFTHSDGGRSKLLAGICSGKLVANEVALRQLWCARAIMYQQQAQPWVIVNHLAFSDHAMWPDTDKHDPEMNVERDSLKKKSANGSLGLIPTCLRICLLNKPAQAMLSVNIIITVFWSREIVHTMSCQCRSCWIAVWVGLNVYVHKQFLICLCTLNGLYFCIVICTV